MSAGSNSTALRPHPTLTHPSPHPHPTITLTPQFTPISPASRQRRPTGQARGLNSSGGKLYNLLPQHVGASRLHSTPRLWLAVFGWLGRGDGGKEVQERSGRGARATRARVGEFVLVATSSDLRVRAAWLKREAKSDSRLWILDP